MLITQRFDQRKLYVRCISLPDTESLSQMTSVPHPQQTIHSRFLMTGIMAQAKPGGSMSKDMKRQRENGWRSLEESVG